MVLENKKYDLIIGGCANYQWDQLKYWVNSIEASGFTGKKALVGLNMNQDTLDVLIDKKFLLAANNPNGPKWQPTNSPIHVFRFFQIWNLLDALKNDPPGRVIMTDVRDVVFQKNPSEWLDGCPKPLIASSESILYKNEPWGNQNLYQTFGADLYPYYCNNVIYNVGVVAGKYQYVKDLAFMIYEMSLGRPIPIVDQAVYNVLIQQTPWKNLFYFAQSENAWACQAGTTADPRKINQFRPFLLEPEPKFDGSKVMTNAGHEFTIVHQYDRVPEWKEYFERKFG